METFFGLMNKNLEVDINGGPGPLAAIIVSGLPAHYQHSTALISSFLFTICRYIFLFLQNYVAFFSSRLDLYVKRSYVEMNVHGLL